MTKTGRGRVYRISGKYQVLPQFGATLEYLDELRLRLGDMLDDVPPELGNRAPEWSANSIFYLGAHMVWVEQHWIERAVNGRYPVQTVLESNLSTETAIEKEQLLRALDEVGEKVTHLYLERIERGTCTFSQTGPFELLSELLQHLCWHYSYHSGQIGLLRRYVGLTYKWNFG